MDPMSQHKMGYDPGDPNTPNGCLVIAIVISILIALIIFG